ncbi:MAG: hypothetical protein ABI367_12270 [Mucilaginibacter sp.]
MKKELIFSLIGYACVFIVCLVMGLWIFLATSGEKLPFNELKQNYLRYFPALLANALLITVIDIVLLGISILFFNLANNRIISSGWKLTNKLLIGLSCVLLFWQVFSLM